MEWKLQLKIIRRPLNKAFTLMESVIVLLIISMSMLISVPLMRVDISSYAIEDWFKSEMVVLQMDAIRSHTIKELEIHYDKIKAVHQRKGNFQGNGFTVNAWGRVSKATTIEVYSNKQIKRIKVWLGMGKIYVE